MSYIVEFKIPIFIDVEGIDDPDEAEKYAVMQLDNQSVYTVIEEALEAKTSFAMGDVLDEDISVNEAEQ